jgi:putative ABC transport system permease protein
VEIFEAPIIEIDWLDVLAAGGLVMIAVVIARRAQTGLARVFALGAIRAVVQLALVGYVLAYVFGLDRWYVVIAALALMTAVAAREVTRRQPAHPRGLYSIAGLALAVGSGLTLLYVVTLVVRPEPWYQPRYVLPLFGMIVANAMNAAALVADRLAGEIETRQAEIEAYLALGASSTEAARESTTRALRAALIPTVNSLMIVGVVSLPGMMTGQILSGTSPQIAVRYQVLVMFMLAAAVCISASLTAVLYRRRFFTAAEQLRPTTR